MLVPASAMINGGVDYNWNQDGAISGFLNIAYQSIIIGYKPYTTNVVISHRQFVSNETDNNGYKKNKFGTSY